MDFELTEEHRLLEQSVREWAGREVAPRIRELDRAHRFDRGLLPQMASLGLLGISVPEAQGGSGMDYLALGLAWVSTRSRFSAGVPTIRRPATWCRRRRVSASPPLP
jgi:alkylation response protein AidB-like acyl-CoA dehydrogenase